MLHREPRPHSIYQVALMWTLSTYSSLLALELTLVRASNLVQKLMHFRVHVRFMRPTSPSGTPVIVAAVAK